MNRDHYQTGCVNNSMGLGRSLSCLLDDGDWSDFDRIARSQNTSKANIARELIKQYVKDNKWRIQAKSKATGSSEKSSKNSKTTALPPKESPSVVPLRAAPTKGTSGVQYGAWIASLNAKEGRKPLGRSTGS